MTETASRPTLEAVAARAGVSRATVSRVVNGSDGVREPLAERVRRAVEELGYVPNQAARSLVTKRHDAVAVVIAEPETRVFADPFFALQLRGISKELTAHDSQLVLLLTEGRDDHTRVGRYLAGGHVDGALVFSLHLDDPLPGLIQRAGVPTVFGGRPGWSEGTRDVVYVDSDNRGGARQAVRHLVELGRKRIGHISGVLDQTSAVDRLDGYRDVMAGAAPGWSWRATSRPPAASAACGNSWTAAPTSTRCSPPTTWPPPAPCACSASAGCGCRRTSRWSVSTTCCPSPSRPTHR
ncbi:hypothetical protein GCM10014715_62230 [Streptomyces spiralis]|uniref:HTH lacI-type domain-containing protein n=1 Tax=Streptomyces spiralis TaxID=66376 RepID=A0A919E0K3_9ACTN|nr:hypothetical protein GCM10014715_62230 [Streptomyces spiralis]